MLAGQVARIGDVVEASPSDARLLIGMGKAIASAPTVQAIELELESKPQSPKRRAKP
jgi:hypothetical protein